MNIQFTSTELDRIRFIIRLLRLKLAAGQWSLNGEQLTADDVALLQRIVDQAPSPPQ